jgi:hypothetical protein
MSDLPVGVAPAVRLLLADLDGAALQRVATTVRARHEAAVAAGDSDGHAAMTALSALVSERLAPSAHDRATGPTGGPWTGSAPQT